MTRKAKDYASLALLKGQLEDRLKAVNAQMRAIETEVVDEFIDEGIQNIRVNIDEPTKVLIECMPHTLELAAECMEREGWIDEADAVRSMRHAAIDARTGQRTVFLRSTIRANIKKLAGDVDCHDLSLRILSEHPDTEFLVKSTVNASALSAVVREYDRDENGDPILPDDLGDAIEIRNETRASVVKG